MSLVVRDVRAALKTALETVSGLRAMDYVPDSIVPPMAVVLLDRYAYHTTFGRGVEEMVVNVVVFVARATERNSQQLLDGYVGSIKAAIESDDTLGGTAGTVMVTEARDFGTSTFGGVDYLTATWEVHIHG